MGSCRRNVTRRCCVFRQAILEVVKWVALYSELLQDLGVSHHDAALLPPSPAPEASLRPSTPGTASHRLDSSIPSPVGDVVRPPTSHASQILALGFCFQQRRWREAERRHPTGREIMNSPTRLTLQDPILLTPWLYFRGGGFPNAFGARHTMGRSLSYRCTILTSLLTVVHYPPPPTGVTRRPARRRRQPVSRHPQPAHSVARQKRKTPPRATDTGKSHLAGTCRRLGPLPRMRLQMQRPRTPVRACVS